MDLKEFTEYNFINNLKKPSDYQYQLDTIKQKLLPLMDEFKKYYVFFNKSPEYPEYQPTFENIKNNIQLLNSSFFIILKIKYKSFNAADAYLPKSYIFSNLSKLSSVILG